MHGRSPSRSLPLKVWLVSPRRCRRYGALRALLGEPRVSAQRAPMRGPLISTVAVPETTLLVREICILLCTLLFLFDLFLDVRIQIDGERQEYLHITDEQTGPMECKEDIQLALVPVHLEQWLHLLQHRDLRSHSNKSTLNVSNMDKTIEWN